MKPAPEAEPEKLPDELLYAEDGHASDVVLTCLADGEIALVPDPLVAHVTACPTCSSQLGNAALLSLRTHEEMKLHLAHVRAKESPAHSPYLALGLGLLVALLGALPRLATLPGELASSGKEVARGGPTLLLLGRKMLVWLAHAAEARGPSVSFLSALLLGGFAVVLAVRLSRRESRSF